MSLESISFLTYFGSRLPADTVSDDDVILLMQGDSVRQIPKSDFSEALALESGGGTPATLVDGTTLTGLHGVVNGAPDDGITITWHMPLYASVSARKRYKLKNIGQGSLEIDLPDLKTIDGEAILRLAPGDRCEVYKDGMNWQTF